mmetsp:Transcript_34091/g.55580  ORF Transcript_34091/g.55580 Transcript_34091/m.55580 type:complete len:425 (-) Transcript_34091:19-1293(-)
MDSKAESHSTDSTIKRKRKLALDMDSSHNNKNKKRKTDACVKKSVQESGARKNKKKGKKLAQRRIGATADGVISCIKTPTGSTDKSRSVSNSTGSTGKKSRGKSDTKATFIPYVYVNFKKMAKIPDLHVRVSKQPKAATLMVNNIVTRDVDSMLTTDKVQFPASSTVRSNMTLYKSLLMSLEVNGQFKLFKDIQTLQGEHKIYKAYRKKINGEFEKKDITLQEKNYLQLVSKALLKTITGELKIGTEQTTFDIDAIRLDLKDVYTKFFVDGVAAQNIENWTKYFWLHVLSVEEYNTHKVNVYEFCKEDLQVQEVEEDDDEHKIDMGALSLSPEIEYKHKRKANDSDVEAEKSDGEDEHKHKRKANNGDVEAGNGNGEDEVNFEAENSDGEDEVNSEAEKSDCNGKNDMDSDDNFKPFKINTNDV